MDREKFVVLLKKLEDKYPPSRSNFTTDDYYKQIQYLNDNCLDKLEDRIMEQCHSFPSTKQLYTIGLEFRMPFQKKEHPDINYDNCSVYYDNGDICGMPVYKSAVDPYKCKKHYEQHLQYLKDTHCTPEAIDYYENGPRRMPDTEEYQPLRKTLEGLKEGNYQA